METNSSVEGLLYAGFQALENLCKVLYTSTACIKGAFDDGCASGAVEPPAFHAPKYAIAFYPTNLEICAILFTPTDDPGPPAAAAIANKRS